MHNTKGKVICKCKNDKPPGEVIKIYFPPLKKGWGGGVQTMVSKNNLYIRFLKQRMYVFNFMCYFLYEVFEDLS